MLSLRDGDESRVFSCGRCRAYWCLILFISAQSSSSWPVNLMLGSLGSNSPARYVGQMAWRVCSDARYTLLQPLSPQLRWSRGRRSRKCCLYSSDWNSQGCFSIAGGGGLSSGFGIGISVEELVDGTYHCVPTRRRRTYCNCPLSELGGRYCRRRALLLSDCET